MIYNAEWGRRWRADLQELCPEMTERQILKAWRRLVRRLRRSDAPLRRAARRLAG